MQYCRNINTCGVRFLRKSHDEFQDDGLVCGPQRPRLPQPLLLLDALPLVGVGAALLDKPGGGRDFGTPQSSLETLGGGASPQVLFDPLNFPKGLKQKSVYYQFTYIN